MDLLETLADPQAERYLSAASAWEISIKYAVGKLPLPEPPTICVPQRMRLSRFAGLAITHAHALAMAALPPLHRDPFDRVLGRPGPHRGTPTPRRSTVIPSTSCTRTPTARVRARTAPWRATSSFRDRFRHVLRCDIYRFFPAIDHAILKRDLRRRIGCPRTLSLAETIIDASNPQEPVDLYYLGDGLFTPWERRRGLPIGNLTSQFFANVYLDGLDHFCKEVLRARGYLRYVDDFALFDDDADRLEEWRRRIARYLEGRRLRLHP